MRTPILIILLTLAWVPWGEAGTIKLLESDGKCHYRHMVWKPSNGTCEMVYSAGEAGDPLPLSIDLSGGLRPSEWIHDSPTKEDLAGALRVRLVDPCVYQMEAAMEAMEPWVSGLQPRRFDPNKSEVRFFFHDKEIYDEITHATQLWDAAKTACWHTP